MRVAWRVMVAGETGIEARRLVFVDECGANISLVPPYAWSRRGEWAPAKALRNRGKIVTLLSSMSLEGMGPSLAVEGAPTRGVFEAYLEGMLAPTLSPGQVVVMDNLSAHKGGRVRQIIEGRGCELLYLPPYSPDLNPIEEAFAKLKSLLRKSRARSHETLVEAIGRGAGRHHGRRRPKFLQPSRLPCFGPIFVTNALVPQAAPASVPGVGVSASRLLVPGLQSASE